MSRSGALRFVGPLVLAAGVLLTPGYAAAAQRCDTLTGKVLVRDSKVKVVASTVKDARLSGTRVLGCALPRGRVFTVAERGTPQGDRYANAVTYSLGAHAGVYLDVRRFSGDGAAQTEELSYGVLDLRTGQRRTYFHGFSGEGACPGGGDDSSRSTPPLAQLVLSAGGLFAALYVSDPASAACYPNDGQALLYGFLSGGERITLDLAPAGNIAPDSVSILDSDFRWTNAGVAREESGGR